MGVDEFGLAVYNTANALCHCNCNTWRVDAAVHGDRQAALQCLLLDPVVDDIEAAQAILDDYLESYREYLPQFWQ